MLWGGRFGSELNNMVLEFTSSFPIDKELFSEDIDLNCAHALGLAKIGIISENEASKIVEGLKQIQQEWNDKKWNPDDKVYEDVHSAIEARLFEIIGDLAGKLHSGKSRNDQIATDFRLWTKKSSKVLIENIRAVQTALINKAEKYIDYLFPGYTHLQTAQPVTFAHHLTAYVEALERDKARIKFTINESDEMPLGSGALAGSTLPLDRGFVAEKLGFQRISSNSLDAVSDRDFFLDFLNCCSIGMSHLSRFCEELIIWSSQEWNFIKLHENFTTGSSMMPQKKNPDVAELIRGRTGIVYGNQFSALTLMKGLPLSYNRDMQEDKLLAFNSFKIYTSSLIIFAQMISTIELNDIAIKASLNKSDFLLATDLAEWLTKEGIPFRKAHQIVGELVKLAEENNKKLSDFSLNELKSINNAFNESALETLDYNKCLYSKNSKGSPNPKFIAHELSRLKSIIK